MLRTAFAPQLSLRDSSRVPVLSRDAGLSAIELACLLICGAAATAVAGFFHPSLKIPGHAILYASLPMALGLALAPRNWVGIVMSLCAGGAWAAMSAAHLGSFQLPAMLSVLALGPVMDLAMFGGSKGWRLYIRLVAAGAVANMLALALKLIGAQLGMEMGGGGQLRNFSFTTVLVSYILCGGLAGLLGAAIGFRLRVGDDLRRN